MGILKKSLIGIIPFLTGILLVGNSLIQQSSGQFSAGVFFLLGAIILTIYFSDEEKSQKFIRSLILPD